MPWKERAGKKSNFERLHHFKMKEDLQRDGMKCFIIDTYETYKFHN